MNDYTLLRKINRDEFVMGMKVLDDVLGLCEFVAGPDDHDCVVVRHTSPDTGRVLFLLFHADDVKLPPLAWLEGKPVYRGDTVYHKQYGAVLVAGYPIDLNECSWKGPKTKHKGWVNIYRDSDDTLPKVSRRVYETREIAKAVASRTELLGVHVACVEVEWEE